MPALCWRWRWVVYSSSSPRVIGFVGNEIAAPIRTRAGKRLNSPALVAYGNHARVDGFVSLGVIASAAVVALGVPVADPVIGLVITLVILHIAWESWHTVRGSGSSPLTPHHSVSSFAACSRSPARSFASAESASCALRRETAFPSVTYRLNHRRAARSNLTARAEKRLQSLRLLQAAADRCSSP